MTGKIHAIAGVGTAIALTAITPEGFNVLGIHVIPILTVITAAAGSYAPDIDMTTTHEGRKHKIASKVVNKVGGGHRGITHTMLVPAILCVLLYFLSMQTKLGQMRSVAGSLIFGFLLGYVCHLFADMFNGKGIPLFWPLLQSKVHVADFESNGIQAWLWLVLYFLILGAIIYMKF
jgi:inner membrane protein